MFLNHDPVVNQNQPSLVRAISVSWPAKIPEALNEVEPYILFKGAGANCALVDIYVVSLSAFSLAANYESFKTQHHFTN